MVDRILIVGFGSIGKKHAKLINKLWPKIRVAVVTGFPIESQYQDIVDEKFGSLGESVVFNADAAIICNAATKHLDSSICLAKRGIHLLVEKPLSDSSKGVAELINICNKNRIVLSVGYNLRYSDSLNFFKSQIESKAVGKILSVRAVVGQYLPGWRVGFDYKKSVSANKSDGGGVLLELSHEIDYLRWIFGEVLWSRSIYSKQSDLEIDVEDTAHMNIGFRSDKLSETTVIANLNMDFIRHDKTRSCEAIGEHGTLRWDGIKNLVQSYTRDSDDWETIYMKEVDTNNTYELEIMNFLESINHGVAPKCTGEDALAVLKVIDNAKLIHWDEID